MADYWFHWHLAERANQVVIQYLIEMIDLIKRNTRRYAKRQMTWFNKDKRIHWFNVDESTDLRNIAEQIIKII